MRKIGLVVALSLLMGCQGIRQGQQSPGFSTSQATYFSRLPAVWAVRKDSAVITFSTEGEATLTYGERPALMQQAKNIGSGQDHRYVLVGLKPNTLYKYLVKTADGTAESSFTTEGTGSFTFAAFGDSRPNDGDELPEVFPRLIREMADHSPKFAVGVGDNIQLTPWYGLSITDKVVRGRYDAYLKSINSLNCTTPFYMALGNHDKGTDPIAMKGFNEAFVVPQNGGNGFYSWDYSGSHFVVLNTELNPSKADLGYSQLQWLEKDLKNSDGPTFVFMHRPFFGGKHSNDFEHSNLQQRDQLVTLFKQNRVKAVFFGHDHYYNHKFIDGIHYVITGGAGAPEADAPEGGAEGPHFLMVTVDGDRLGAEVLTETGKHITSW